MTWHLPWKLNLSVQTLGSFSLELAYPGAWSLEMALVTYYPLSQPLLWAEQWPGVLLSMACSEACLMEGWE